MGANWDDGPQCFIDGKPKNIRIDWDPLFGKNVSEKDKRAAIKAYLNFLSDPGQFAEYYVNPASASQDYDALELFAQYTSLHTTADNTILDVVAKTFGMDAVEALNNARLHNVEAAASKDSSILHAGEAILSVVFPTAAGQLMHIFRDAEGHFAEDNAINRSLLVDTVEDTYFVEVDPHGNSIYARVLNDGTEVWAEVRGGVIRNGGLNQVPIWKK